MPVFFLYFNQRFTVAEVLLLESIYYATVVVIEVPSGYFSDRVGRKATLMISSIALFLSYLLFAASEPFWMFVIAQMLLATGIALQPPAPIPRFTMTRFNRANAATNTLTVKPIVARNGLLMNGLAALVGGAVGLAGLHYAYIVSAIAAFCSIMIVLRFTEPSVKKRGVIDEHFMIQVRSCLKLLRSPSLAWLFFFAVLMTVLNHVPYEFYQAYIDFAIAATRDASSATAGPDLDELTQGLRASETAAGRRRAFGCRHGPGARLPPASSVKVRDRMGVAYALLLAASVQAAVIAMMGWILSLWIVPLILLRVIPRALMTAPLNAAISPRVDQAHRATYLSIQSLVGRLSFSIVLFGLSFLATETGNGDADWISVSNMLRAAMIIAIVGIVLLAIASPVLKKTKVKTEQEE